MPPGEVASKIGGIFSITKNTSEETGFFCYTKNSEVINVRKKADLNEDVTLYPHQKRVVEKPGNAVVAAHAVGSGKTLTAIARFEKLKQEGKANKALVISPAGLRDNFGVQGVGKFTNSKFNMIGNQQEARSGKYGKPDPDADYNIISYDLFRRDPLGYLKATGADTVIADEFHRGKNEGTITTDALKDIKGHYNHFIGLTGSLVSNTLSDVHPLVDVATGGSHALGKNKDEFESRFLQRSQNPIYRGMAEKRIPVTGFKNKKLLEKELTNTVDYTDYEEIKELANMPGKNVQIIKVPLTGEQAQAYKKLLKQHPDVMKMIRQKRLETLRDDEMAKAFNQMIEARKLMNSIGTVRPGMSLAEAANESAKTKKLMDDLVDHLKKTPDGQALLFSHLIHGGVDTMEAALQARHIPYGKFIGKGNENITEESRQQDVIDYNNRLKRVLLVSPAGGEGISLNDTTFEGVLDPHFNPEKMKQMEARGVRSGGLSHRPDDLRNVQINRYIATMPKTWGIFPSSLKTPDEWIYEIAQRKDQQNQLLYRLLKQEQARQMAQGGQ